MLPVLLLINTGSKAVKQKTAGFERLELSIQNHHQFSQTNQHQGQLHIRCQSQPTEPETHVSHTTISLLSLVTEGWTSFRKLSSGDLSGTMLFWKKTLNFFPYAQFFHGYSPGMVFFEVLSYALTPVYTLVSGLSQSPLPSTAWEPFLRKL